MALQSTGWNTEWAQAFAPHAAEGLTPGRVLVEHREMFMVATDSGERRAEVSGSLRHAAQRRADLPAVGDFVALRLADESGPGIIQAVLPRRTAFVRKAAGARTEEQVVAANIDLVFILSALDHDFNVRRLERYLTLAWDSGARPVILLNKADLCADLPSHLRQVERIAFDVPIHVLSALTGDGLRTLEPYLQSGQTVGVLGSSGVGKSTLINQLLGQDVQATGRTQPGTDRGRHTTSHRQLFVLPSGALIIDTPGMRELQLWASDEGLQNTFSDLEELARACSLRQCQHKSEPGCAVRAAIERGELLPERLASYAKLARELRYLETQKDGRAMLERKRADKRIHKALKAFKKQD